MSPRREGPYIEAMVATDTTLFLGTGGEGTCGPANKERLL